MRAWAALLLMMSFLFMLAFHPDMSSGNGSGGFALRSMDLRGDTVEAYYVERGYDGLAQLDITLFRTYEDRSTFHALLRVYDDISVTPGFLYSMSLWRVNIVVDSGTVQVWKGDDPSDTVSGVDVTWSDQELHATMPRSILDLGSAPPDASAQYYRLDPLGEKRMETVMDEVGWKGTLPLNPYDMEIPDPKGDVVQSIVETKHRQAPSLDIIDVRLSLEDGRMDVVMELYGPPDTGQGVRYRVLAGELDLRWSDGVLEVGGSGAWKVLASEAVISGSLLTITATISEPLVSPFMLHCETLEWTEDGGWMGDSAPGPEGLFTALLPFGMGKALSCDVNVNVTGEVAVSISFEGFDAELSAMVKERADTDGDGSVGRSEADLIFRDALECIESGDWMGSPVIDGEESELVASVRTEGLIGPTVSSEDLKVYLSLSAEGAGLHDGWSVSFPGWRHKAVSEGPLDENGHSRLEITVPEGFYIDPPTLEPALLGNYLTIEGRGVRLDGTGPDALSLASGGFALKVKLDGTDDDDGRDDDDDEGPWPLYLIASAAMLIFLIALVAWWRQRGRKDD